jgi:cytoskeletal protein CcmA (bactofilin family)
MFGKKEPEDVQPRDISPVPTHNPPPRAAEPSRTKDMSPIVNIGQSIFISGELSGNEDLTIEGRVEGRIELRDHNLVIGPKGKIQAEIHAKTVTVHGEVTGNIRGDDRVEITNGGMVKGDIHAPRIVVADGARFKGTVDMEKANEPGVVRKDRPPQTVIETRPLGSQPS